ncbi:unnamed protein product [Parascedosporium putredinis]|uniref:Uncharacterized protein n=1 Tax=Parascedosporium putredinis TaxID=1442378 RepID=A0A9P1H2F6_9PEZI|nr:unnamed protein product [Parascedosporium putredinis]CAI7994930.1 unnamed protein product [Parascedosporium putredinis]
MFQQSFLALVVLAASVVAQNPAPIPDPQQPMPDYVCKVYDEWYSQCLRPDEEFNRSTEPPASPTEIPEGKIVDSPVIIGNPGNPRTTAPPSNGAPSQTVTSFVTVTRPTGAPDSPFGK